jgi:hypothetical protein
MSTSTVDIATIFAQAYNDQQQIFVVADSHHVTITDTLSTLCNFFNDLELSTSFIYIYNGTLPGVELRSNDVLMNLGVLSLDGLARAAGAFYIEVRPDDLSRLTHSMINYLKHRLFVEGDMANVG